MKGVFGSFAVSEMPALLPAANAFAHILNILIGVDFATPFPTPITIPRMQIVNVGRSLRSLNKHDYRKCVFS